MTEVFHEWRPLPKHPTIKDSNDYYWCRYCCSVNTVLRPECTCSIDGTPYCKAKGTGLCKAEEDRKV